MVDLPTIQNSVPQVHAPQSRVSAADVASPYRDLAQAMKTIGHEGDEVAGRLGEQAGFRAVTTDADGNIQVEKAPLVGQAADKWKHAVKMSALVQGEGAARRDILALRNEYKDDAEGFTQALDTFKKAKIKQWDDAVGPEVGLAIGRIIDRTGTQVYRGLINRKQTSDAKGATADMVGRLDQWGEDISTLTESGATNTPEFAENLTDYKATLKAAADNPLIDFSPAQAQAHFDRTLIRAREAAFIGGVRQAYAQAGPDGAQEHIDEHLPASFPPLERGRLAARADQEVDALEAKADRLEIDRARAPIIARESREAEGYQRLAAGEMSPGWLDRYGDEIGAETRTRFTLAAEAPGGSQTDPAVSGSLTMAALGDPASVGPMAADALISGQMTRGDYTAAHRLASQVAADAQARPWANDLRRNVAALVMGDRAAQRGGAVAEVSDLLAGNPDMPPAEARKIVGEVVGSYLEQDRRVMRASLPPLRFAGVPKDPGEVATAEASIVGDALAGRMSLGDLVSHSRLAAQWRDAVTKDV